MVEYLDELLADPAAFGITNTRVGALTGNKALGIPPLEDHSFDGPGASYFFWDALAPTTRVHCYLADAIYDDAFAFGTASDDQPGIEVIETSPDRLRLYAWNLPVGERLKLMRWSGSQWLLEQEFTPADPCRLFDIARFPTVRRAIFAIRR